MLVFCFLPSGSLELDAGGKAHLSRVCQRGRGREEGGKGISKKRRKEAEKGEKGREGEEKRERRRQPPNVRIRATMDS